jgi:hypothetical protein
MKDRRKDVRLRAIAGRNMALLRIGLREFEVELANESARGFGVTVPAGASVEVGDSLTLGTLSGWFDVKVVRSDSTPSGVVLGLERGPEIAPPRRTGVVSRLAIVAAAVVGLLSFPAATAVVEYWRKPEPAKGRPALVISPAPAAEAGRTP